MNEGFKITDRRYLEVQQGPVSLPPRPPMCYEVVKNPNVHDSRRCYHESGHEDAHAWEYCPATHQIGSYEGDLGCDLLTGHELPHRCTTEWK